MLLALAGVTGVGKTYYTEKIAEQCAFKKVRTIRTRKMRKCEQNGKTGLFMSEEELKILQEEGKIAYAFKVFGGTYAYLKEDIFSEDDMVFEIHYTTIYDWKKIRPDIKTIYIFPNNIDEAKKVILNRNLEKSKEIERIAEVDEHYNRMISDEKLRSIFDYIVYNNYDDNSETEILKIVKGLKRSN